MSGSVGATMAVETLRMSVPYVCAALGGVVSERSGVVNIALDGLMLASALGGVATAIATGSAVAGVAGGVATGVLLALLHAVVVVRGRVDGIVSGVAIQLLAAAGTRFTLRALYDSASNSPSIEGFRLGPAGAGATEALARVLLDPIAWLALVAVAGVPWLLRSTRFGLRLRGAGENPEAAAAAGVNVGAVRIAAVALSGALCALGGLHLAFDQHRFESGMTGGRGFIGLAAVIVAGWRPGRAVLACLGFAALDAAQIVLQDRVAVAHELLQALPYVATLVAIAGLTRGARAPAGLGRHPDPHP